MNGKNELIEKYLYDVVRRLPEKQRQDIEKELRTLIEDMLEERLEQGTKNEDACVKEVLTELGNPAKLARKYRGEGDSLISGEYYDSYCFVLKIVLICAGAGILISSIISSVVQVIEKEQLADYIWQEGIASVAAIPGALIQVFGVITLIYAIMERNHVKLTDNGNTWTVDKLPQIPYGKAVISKGDCVVGLVFSILFMVLFLFAPQLMGMWVKQDGVIVSIPVFNLAVWRQILISVLICTIAGMIDEFVKLVIGRYNYTVMTVTIIMNMIGFASVCILLKTFPVWNPNFLPELEMTTNIFAHSKGDILTYFNTPLWNNLVLVFALLGTLLEIGTTVYRTLRYGEGMKEGSAL